MKTSQFNEYIGFSEGRGIVYNNLSSAMLELSEHVYNSLLNNQISVLSTQQLNILSQAGFLVDEAKNEVQEIRQKKLEIQENAAVIGLQILPVRGCNFYCAYCFQKSKDKIERMSIKTMDKIREWVTKSIKTTTRVLNVMWFGGEPLLAINQINYLSKAFLEITRSKNLKYYSSIISNGYLLVERVIEILLKNDVKSCMVTVDGPEEIHNKRRMLKNGGKTWQKIVDNVKMAVKLGMAINIRINVDKTNIDQIDGLFVALNEANILNRVGYNFGRVTTIGDACSSIEDTVLSTEDMSIIFKNKRITDALSHAMNYKSRTPADFVGCVATAKHSYIVDQGGELYKCSKTIGNPEEMCGYIDKPDPYHPNFIKWLNLDNFFSDYCSDCSMFPICRGNICALDILNKSGRYEQCQLKKHHPEYIDRLIKIYQNKVIKPIKNNQEVTNERH